MQNVETDMIRMDRESAVRRPSLSPRCPQTKPPNGRTKNEMANRAKVASRAVCGSDSGKNTTAMVAARYP